MVFLSYVMNVCDVPAVIVLLQTRLNFYKYLGPLSKLCSLKAAKKLNIG